MKLFGLVAVGGLKYMDAKGQILCKEIFSSEAAAEEYKPAFLKLCTESKATDVKSLNDLDVNHIKISIVEFDLSGE